MRVGGVESLTFAHHPAVSHAIYVSLLRVRRERDSNTFPLHGRSPHPRLNKVYLP